MTKTTENSIPTRQRAPWNSGRLIGQKRPLKPKGVWTIRVRLQMEGRRRDLAMSNVAMDSKLKGLRTSFGCDRRRVRRRASPRSRQDNGQSQDHRHEQQRLGNGTGSVQSSGEEQ